MCHRSNLLPPCITDAHCRAAKPKEQLYRLNDLRGLYLEVKPNGVKAWRYRFKLEGFASGCFLNALDF